MAALTADRNTPQMGGLALVVKTSYPVADNVLIFKGALVAIDGNGRAIPAATGLGLKCAGRAAQHADNTIVGHTAGGITVEVEEGINRWGNADAIVQAQVGQIAWMVDDNNVSQGSAGKSPAGVIYAVDSGGVWVYTGLAGAASSGDAAPDMPIVSVPVSLVAHSNGSVAARFTPGFNGTIVGLHASVTEPVTTAAKAATFTPAIAGTPTTGGALALTSANCTPVGAKIDATAITALNSFTSAQEITLVASAVTAFAEGEVVAYLMLQAQ